MNEVLCAAGILIFVACVAAFLVVTGRAYASQFTFEHKKVGGLTMEIKTRIDALTEAGAKAALYYLVNFVGATEICKTCPLHQECFHDIEATSCKERFLNWAIVDFEREARK